MFVDVSFEWHLEKSELERLQIEVSVKNQVGLFAKGRAKMGLLQLDLSQFGDLALNPQTQWYIASCCCFVKSLIFTVWSVLQCSHYVLSICDCPALLFSSKHSVVTNYNNCIVYVNFLLKQRTHLVILSVFITSWQQSLAAQRALIWQH